MTKAKLMDMIADMTMAIAQGLIKDKNIGTKMALIKCKECKEEISSKAKQCPKCGAPIKKTGIFGKICLVIIGLMVIGAISNGIKGKSSYRSQSYTPAAPIIWNYSQSPDEVSGKPTYFASIESENTVNFGFPYRGEQRASLTLRTHPRYGKDLMISVSKGQFNCSYNGCRVSVRFDDGSVKTYSATRPESHDYTTLFINNYSGFARKLLKAKKVYIEAGFYQEGNRTFEFTVDGFSVEQYRPKQ